MTTETLTQSIAWNEPVFSVVIAIGEFDEWVTCPVMLVCATVGKVKQMDDCVLISFN